MGQIIASTTADSYGSIICSTVNCSLLIIRFGMMWMSFSQEGLIED